MSQLTEAVLSIALAIIGLATLSVILSPKANTVGVTKAATQGFATDIGAAISPVTGGGGFSLGSPSFGDYAHSFGG